MPYGELKINGTDAYESVVGGVRTATYHLSLSDGAKAELMTPPAAKQRAYNESRLRHGRTMAGTVERMEARELSLPMHITAKTSEEGLAYYNAFCQLLAGGTLDIMYRGLPTVEFHCKYLSCSNFTEVRSQMMKFTLKVEEPDPSSRTITQGHEW